MADPQTGNWITFGSGQQFDPTTGQARWWDKRKGDWSDPVQTPQTGINQQTGQVASYLGGVPQPGMQMWTPDVSGTWGSSMLPTYQQSAQANAIYLAQLQAQQKAAQAQPAGTAGAPQSYLGAVPQQINMGGAWQPAGAQGAGGVPGAQGAAQSSGGNMAKTTAGQIPTGIWGGASNADIGEWQKWYGANVGKSILVNGQARTLGSDIQPGELWDAFRGNNVGWGTVPGPQGAQAPAQAIGGPGQAQPESLALAQMAQIDPRSEALRSALGQSYLSNLQNMPQAPQFGLDLSRGAAAPAAGDVQSYLNLYKQIDPQGFAQRQALAGQMGSYLNQVQQQAALGAQLDPGTIREVTQGVRQAQAARGNVYGTPQLVAETMARGTAGEQRLLARQQMLGQALGQQQGYLTSGAGMGDVANQLYNQGYGRYLQGYGTALGGWQAQQQARLASQGAALGYLGSGQTPYQAGASYLNMAQQNAAQAAQGGPQYNPTALGQQYTGAGAPSFPQYGLDMSQLAGNWYNNINQANLQAYGLQQAYGQKGGSGMGAAAGALGGAASGALAGSAAGPFGTIIGGLGGALAGGLSGYSK